MARSCRLRLPLQGNAGRRSTRALAFVGDYENTSFANEWNATRNSSWAASKTLNALSYARATRRASRLNPVNEPRDVRRCAIPLRISLIASVSFTRLATVLGLLKLT